MFNQQTVLAELTKILHLLHVLIVTQFVCFVQDPVHSNALNVLQQITFYHKDRCVQQIVQLVIGKILQIKYVLLAQMIAQLVTKIMQIMEFVSHVIQDFIFTYKHVFLIVLQDQRCLFSEIRLLLNVNHVIQVVRLVSDLRITNVLHVMRDHILINQHHHALLLAHLALLELVQSVNLVTHVPHVKLQ